MTPSRGARFRTARRRSASGVVNPKNQPRATSFFAEKRANATHARGARGARRPASRLDGPRSARESVRAPRAIFFATTSVDDAAARGGEIGRNRIERGVTFRRAATASPPRRVAPRPNERRDRARDVFSYDF